jgi:hypothetical protein
VAETDEKDRADDEAPSQPGDEPAHDDADDDGDGHDSGEGDDEEADDDAGDDGEDAADDDADSDDEEADDEEADDEEADDEEADDEEADDEEADDEEADADGEPEDDDAVASAPAAKAAPTSKRARSADEEGDNDERAASVARSLGVGEEDEEEAADKGERALSRAERRRQRAIKRRTGRKPADDAAPQDRNKRKRQELLERRRRAAAASDDEEPVGRLLPSEMVDDALARGGAATMRWVKRHWSKVQWAIVALVVGGIGVGVYLYVTAEGSAEASDQLAAGVRAEFGTVIPKEGDQRTEEEKKGDIRTVFASLEERQEAALAAYKKAHGEHAGSGPGILAKLGEAGVLLDRREWDGAISAYQAVLDSPLAPADTDVRARALEGLGFAQEGKGEGDAALATFTKLGEVSEDFAALAKYHQARVEVAKGNKDKAKELLNAARKDVEKLELAAIKAESPLSNTWLERRIESELTALDPNAVPKKPGAGSIPPEKLRQMLEQKGLVPPGAPNALPMELPEIPIEEGE